IPPPVWCRLRLVGSSPVTHTCTLSLVVDAFIHHTTSQLSLRRPLYTVEWPDAHWYSRAVGEPVHFIRWSAGLSYLHLLK
ncbi:hypothetical protein DPEC_G00185740, partial [Dallia pectoralis]